MLYWKWSKSIPSEICNFVINENKEKKLEKSVVASGYLPKLRNSKNIFLPRNHFIEGILFNHIRYANKSANWNYDITDCEVVQYTVYVKNELYDWHSDHAFYLNHDNMRKLTVVCQLNDPNEFEGGGLFLKHNEKITDNLLVDQGDVVIFPSYILHKAGLVTSGTRISTVMWATGPAFK